MRQQTIHPRRGLTLIEVLIVIAILLAIGGLVLVNLLPAKDQADMDLQRVQLQQVESALDQFKLNMKRYPTEEEGLSALTSKDALADEADAANWRGPYLKDSVAKDAWNHDLIYRNPSDSRGDGFFDLVSIGPDGEEGTGDDITARTASAGGSDSTTDDFAPPSGANASGGSDRP